MDAIDTLIVGAGVVGLAVARELALSGREVIVVEAAAAFGTGTSSRNSGVVHAGLYYPPGSLKARLCVEGKDRLYRYCTDRNVAVSRIGKLIVAADSSQMDELYRLMAVAGSNGVHDLTMLTVDEMHAIEPEVRGVGALFSPSTGIVDAHGYMAALEGDLQAAGGAVAYHTAFVGAEPCTGGYWIEVGGAEPFQLVAREIVNCAGLAASAVGAAIAGPLAAATPQTHYARGCYFELQGMRSPFRHLVYPVPEPGGLGVHATLDLGGQIRFGPDVEWVDRLSYDVDPGRADLFYAAIRRYWPALRDGALRAAYAGIRPKLSRPGEPAADFLLRCRDGRVIDMMGIESPGLTSSLALATEVRAMLDA